MINVGKEKEPMWLTDVAQSTDLPANRGSIPSRRCDFFPHYLQRPAISWSPPSFISNGYRILSTERKKTGDLKLLTCLHINTYLKHIGVLHIKLYSCSVTRLHVVVLK